jgi:hypothetical protein
MKDRRADDIDPTVFFIIKGKIYVCASLRKGAFLGTVPKAKRRADSRSRPAAAGRCVK